MRRISTHKRQKESHKRTWNACTGGCRESAPFRSAAPACATPRCGPLSRAVMQSTPLREQLSENDAQRSRNRTPHTAVGQCCRERRHVRHCASVRPLSRTYADKNGVRFRGCNVEQQAMANGSHNVLRFCFVSRARASPSDMMHTSHALVTPIPCRRPASASRWRSCASRRRSCLTGPPSRQRATS